MVEEMKDYGGTSMTDDELARLHEALVQDLNDWVAKDREYRELLDRFVPLTTNPGPGEPIRSGERTPELFAAIERSSKEVEEALQRHIASRTAYAEALQRSR